MKNAIAFVACLLVVLQSGAQESDSTSLALRLDPSLEVPLGQSTEYYKLGGSMGAAAEYVFRAVPGVFALGEVGYGLAPIKAEKQMHLVSGGVGAGVYLALSPRFSARVVASGGYFQGMIEATSGFETDGNPYVGGGAGLQFLVNPRISLGIDAGYRNLLGLYDGFRVGVGTSFYLSGIESRQARIRSALPLRPGLMEGPKTPGPGEGVELSSVEFEQIFPVFHAFYDDHSIGRATLTNLENEPVTDVTVNLFIRQFMDIPREVAVIPDLSAGENWHVELNALFTDAILSVTEGTKVAAEITVDYKMGDEPYRVTRSETVRLYHRNAMTWDDDRKASAFVTAKDPAVLSFGKNVAALIRGKTLASVDGNLLKALALHEALSLQGISYVIDPRTPYIEYSKNRSMVDFLQFPRQTMEYRAGDCDDLSILYCALLESVGIETAFVTIPGHIYMAFALAMTSEEADRTFRRPDELIFQGGKVWVPVEVTARDGGFLRAWEQGARQWRQHTSAGQAGFHAIHDAWGLYEPVALPGEERPPTLPAEDALIAAFQREVNRFVNREISPQIADLEARLTGGGVDPRLHNKLGVLYARHGLLDKAEAAFRNSLRAAETVPALVNLGNIHYLREEWQVALELYERARRQAPTNARVLLSVARTYHKLENYRVASRTYGDLKDIDPVLAGRFAYLDARAEEGLRAAALTETEGVVLWAEER
jgi:tetratricopeptide (TPR) repeat protein